MSKIFQNHTCFAANLKLNVCLQYLNDSIWVWIFKWCKYDIDRGIKQWCFSAWQYRMEFYSNSFFTKNVNFKVFFCNRQYHIFNPFIWKNTKAGISWFFLIFCYILCNKSRGQGIARYISKEGRVIILWFKLICYNG